MADRSIGHIEPIALPAPASGASLTVLEALGTRCTTREFSTGKLSVQTLADILWAAQGVNREQGPFGATGRTAGSASNSQEILIYVLMEEGTYLYEPPSHRLTPVAAGDLRRLATSRGQQPRGAEAPIRLVYVVDVERFQRAGFPEPGLYDPDIQKAYYYVDTGLIAQNVYLAAASLGLAAWFHNCDRQGFTEALGLGPEQRPLFGHTVGWPAAR